MILWSVFSIGGDWVVNHIVTYWVCDVALFVGVGVGVNFLTTHGKTPLCDYFLLYSFSMKRSWVVYVVLTSWRGHPPHFDWSVLSTYSVSFLGVSFAGRFIIFLRIFEVTIIFFLVRMKTSLVGRLTDSGSHPCSVQVVLYQGYVILDIGCWGVEKPVLWEIRNLGVAGCFTVIRSFFFLRFQSNEDVWTVGEGWKIWRSRN